MAILRATNLTKTYGVGEAEVKALKSTNLEIESGEFVVIVGPSGSGKSTLLHLLAGLDDPSSGEVFINDVNICKFGEIESAKFRRRKIGFIFQFFNLIPILSVEENIKFPILMDGKSVDNEYIDELTKKLGIEERKNHLPRELSGGQQQRTAIARALINKPDIIFADEPTGNLDSKNSDEVLELLITTIKKYNQTLLMITHDNNIAERADRIITIYDGVIISDKKVGQ